MTIDPGFLDELDRFDAALDRPAAALRQGDHQSPRVGEGLTFSDYRRYSPGDDTRLIDWKLFARTDEFFIKQFEEERSLTVDVLVDASGSMDFGEGSAHKFETAARLGLGVAYLTAEEHNEFRFSTFRDRADRLDGDRSNRGEVLRLVEQLNEITPSGQADLSGTLTERASQIRSRSLVVVLTDCLADPESIATGVSALGRADADVLVVRVVAPEEYDPPAVGDALFVDPESDATRRTYVSGSVAEAYRNRLDEHIETVADRVRTLGADHVVVDTGEDFFDAFARVWLG
ncbi:MAG: DUF58 domain-containing protein [Haloferacaceae archaeon]